jgi:signal transduction histidine kinase
VSNRDITARKRAEMEILERNQKENILIQTIHNMQIDIARDLHDTIGQNVSYLRMKLDYLSEIDMHTQDEIKAEIENMFKVADESYDLIRGTLSVLQAGDSEEPLSVFTRYANQVAERSSFEVTFANQGTAKPLSSYKMRQLFFIFREALSNIEKYARADQVLVEFKWDKNTVNLEITDNGIGFDRDAVHPNDHYGLNFMLERAHLVDGSFLIQSEVGKGTKITVHVPCLDELLITL